MHTRLGIGGWREHRAAAGSLESFEKHWRHGGSALFRSLIDARAIELLGGPLAHPFQPLMDPRLREFSLTEGLSDAEARWGTRPSGIWAPECAYAPGMEKGYAAAGVTHFMVDGPALRGDTTLARPVYDSDVLAFGRDLKVSYRVWSPKSGYPGHAAYRDFHTYDHATGLKHARVTGRAVASQDKAPYDPEAASAAIDKHVVDFVDSVRRRLREESSRIGRPALVVAAFDTELFGHWWFEGPIWLERVLRALPEAGIDVGTLADARSRGYVGAPVELERSSWGSGKDWRGTQYRTWWRSTKRWSTLLCAPWMPGAARPRTDDQNYATRSTIRFCVRHFWLSPATGHSWSARIPPPSTPVGARTSTRTLCARSPTRRHGGMTFAPPNSQRSGIGQTGCSRPSTPGDCVGIGRKEGNDK